jgi:hypothetical protein
MDWATIGLNSSTQSGGTASFTISLRDTTNDTAYSAVAGTTVFASDVVSFSLPSTTATSFTLNLTAADIPNISSYAMAANTSYALILFAPSRAIGLQRTTGFANGTTNNNYTVNSGFTALDTFRNNAPNYSNAVNSFPTLDISFGENTIPEPATNMLTALAGIIILTRRKR